LIDPAATAADDAARAQDVPSDMPQGLTLASVSRDGRRMLFVDANGREFAVEVDDRLRAALPADSPRRTEPAVTNPLRPREIQTRIRAGESAEDVAAAAGTTIDKIMPFAGPVLAEREHMAERAQRGSVRRKAGEPAGSVRTLGEAVAVHLRAFELTPEDVVTWDAYRRTDGRWKVIGDFATPGRSGTAELTFDTAGNYVALDNDDARWLIGDEVQVAAEPVQDDLLAARQRRASAPEPVPTPERAPEPEAVVADEPLDVEMPLEAFLEPDPEPEPKQAPEPVAEKPKSSRRKGRASVPSWDEIMFGGKSD